MNNLIDIQINGYAGIDFNGDLLNEAQLKIVADKLVAGGVRAILVTLITDDVEKIEARLRNFVKLIDAVPAWRKLMPAFHIEGPCLSPVDGYRGAHPLEKIAPADPSIFKRLMDAAPGRVAMVTLAPEVDPGMKTLRWLVENGVVVAIGHTNASMDQLKEAESAGATLFTHLGNGCAHLVDRHDNVINRALSLEKLKYSLIPDGHHLPWFLIRNWIKIAGIERLVFTTDCISAADAPPGRYRIGPWDVEVGANKRVQPPGKNHLAGSALTMREAYENGVKHLGLTAAQAQALCADQPGALIRRWLKG
ncbi:MAG: N-acetylglucosamine-6-phosphate deacetylase [Planctomycetes bacterium]|nr:N-acetylglucosamine-6-phosphate deacetylase [Planctomycetota bacterium]